MLHEPLNDGLLTKSQAAQFIGIHERTLDLWQHDRKIPYLKFGKGRRAMVRFRKADLENFIAAHAVPAIGAR